MCACYHRYRSYLCQSGKTQKAQRSAKQSVRTPSEIVRLDATTAKRRTPLRLTVNHLGDTTTGLVDTMAGAPLPLRGLLLTIDFSEHCPMRSRQYAGAAAATVTAEKLLRLEERHLDAYAPR